MVGKYIELLSSILRNAPARTGRQPWGDWYDEELLIAYLLKAKDFDRTMEEVHGKAVLIDGKD